MNTPMLRRGLHAATVLFLATLFTVPAAGAADLAVRVLRPDGEPAPDARVTLLEADRHARSDGDGRVVFEGIADGLYHVYAESRQFGSVVREALIQESDLEIELRLDRQAHREQVVVTATHTGRGTAEVVQPVTVLDETALNDALQPSLGETLAGQAGVRSTYFGPGASRPVIRGQSGGRVRILEDGLGVGDASTTSPDHAVSVDAATAEQVEILRGASTLLYGGTAVGGVVNVIDRRIPRYAPNDPFTGQLQLGYGGAATEKLAAADLNGNVGSFAWHVDGVTRETDDYDIPGHAVVGDPDSASGTLSNSALETDAWSVGGAWVGKAGFVGASFKNLDSLYGIPAELESDEARGTEAGGVRIDMNQKRYDVRGDLHGDWGLLRRVRFGVGASDYMHAELEGDEVGTRFFSDSLDGRLELDHRLGASGSGILGVQHTRRELEAVGAEAFLPRNDTEATALFAVEEIRRGAVRYEAGLRVEAMDVSTPATVAADGLCLDPRDREFTTVSGSLGVLWLAGDAYSVGGSLSRSARAPSGEELYSCGEHVATLSFEVGDPELDEESALGFDVSVRKRSGRLTGELSLYFNDYTDYIFEAATGATVPAMDPGGLPVFRFDQDDAEVYGAELQGALHLFHDDDRDLDLTFKSDVVRSELDDGTPLPRIPPWRAGLGLSYLGGAWRASAEATYFAEADRLAPLETPTDGYTMVDASLSYRIIRGGLVHELGLRGNNLTDTEARNHASRLKDLVPLPGRGIRASYRLVF